MNTAPQYKTYSISDWEQLYNLYGGVVYGYILKIVPDEKTAGKIFTQAFVNLKYYIININESRCTTVWFIKYAMKCCADFKTEEKTEKEQDLLSEKGYLTAGKAWLINMQKSKFK